jgi:ABC-2 type transport system ATP-binding protein
VLAVRDLHKRYGEVVALDGAAFVVSPGRILGFLGPNGAGKTTTMRVIFGLVDPDAGDVTWGERTITDADRRRFGYMPEERGLYPKMAVREQVVHFGRLSGMGAQDAVAATNRWLALLGIEDRAESKVEDLSHGNQQRVQLAAALVHDPVLLVLDEPFAGLDPLGVDALSVTLQDLANKGTAIVFSSHQLDLVEDVSQDVAIINRGRVVLNGVLDELKAASTTRRLDVVVDGDHWVPDSGGRVVTDDLGRRHTLVESDAPVGEILAAASSAGHVDRFSFEPPSLSDLFREAVRI